MTRSNERDLWCIRKAITTHVFIRRFGMYASLLSRTVCIALVTIALSVHSGIAQVPTPAAAQSQPIYLLGATIHIGDGTVVQNGVIGFDAGKITYVGADQTVMRTAQNPQIIDISGKHVYPGFIAPNTTLGLTEIGAVRATHDEYDVGRIKPHVRTIIAYNTDSRVTPTIRSNGILLAQIIPGGGLITGASSIVELDAWNWEDAAYKMDEGIMLAWPSTTLRAGRDAKKQKERRKKELAELREFFTEAKAYAAKNDHETTNLRFEAMRAVFEGSKNLHVFAFAAKDILASIEFCREFGITPIINGGTDAWMVTDVLKKYNVPVILQRVHRTPGYSDDDYDQPYKTPAQLQKAGVLFCISLGGTWDQRNLMFHAGTAAAFGLTKEEALAAITNNAAKIFKMDDRVGSLQVGKDATLFVSTGDALDMRTNNVEMAFIRGKSIDLDNKQKALYRKFGAKYTGE